MNLMTRQEYANSVATDLTYNSQTHRLENINTSGLQNIDYSFDPVGNIIGITDNIIGENQYFFYDDLDRLILAGSENYSQSFAYNPLGSILAHRSKDKVTNDEIIFGFEYGNGAGIHAPTRVDDTYLLYDANGNLVEDGNFVYVYNDANRLAEVLKKSDNNASIAEFVYDSNGQRIIKTEGGSVSYYISPDYGIDDGEETVYYYANGNRIAKESSEGMFWYLNDHLGSANVMMNESGQLVEHTLYYPFGAHREGGTEKYTFTGKELDSEIGLYYFEARYYNPQTFVFTQADSVIPDVYNPQSLNRYSYCYNNPVKYTDPDGHIPLIVATTAAGAIGGGLIGGGSEFARQYNAAGGNFWGDILRGDVSSVYAFSQSGDVNWKSVGAHAAGGAVAGGVAGLTMGAGVSVVTTGGLLAPSSTTIGLGMLGPGAANYAASGIIISGLGSTGNLAGGVAGRAVENIWNGGSNTLAYALDGGKMLEDIVVGAAGAFAGAAATTVIQPITTAASNSAIVSTVKSVADTVVPEAVSTAAQKGASWFVTTTFSLFTK